MLRNQVVDLPYELEDSEVLVEVHACAVNHVDCQLRGGALQAQYDVALPVVPGTDFSGKVRKIGSMVLNVKVGDSVFGRQRMDRILQGRGGGCAEWCVVDSADVVVKPSNITHEEASGVPTAALVAFGALRMGELPESEEDGADKVPYVAILGGSGGVGSFAIQIAKKHYGAFVLACCSGQNRALVEKLGADFVIDHTSDTWQQELSDFKDFDLVIDCVGLDVYWETFGRKVLGQQGKYITLNNLQGEKPAPSWGGEDEVGEGERPKQNMSKQRQSKKAEEDEGWLLSAKSNLLMMNSFISGFKLFESDQDLRNEDLEIVSDLIQVFMCDFMCVCVWRGGYR